MAERLIGVSLSTHFMRMRSAFKTERSRNSAIAAGFKLFELHEEHAGVRITDV